MDFSWSEMMLVGVVALIVIGPKDLPGLFRELGRITAKLRSMAREFSRAMEQAAKETGVKDVADDLKKVANPAATGLDAMKSAADKFEKWDPLKNKITPSAPSAASAAAATTAAAKASTASAAPAEAAPGEAAPAAAPAMGPATAALAEQQAARKAVAAEAAEKLRKVSTPAASSGAAEAPARKPGRTRKKADPAAGETA